MTLEQQLETLSKIGLSLNEGVTIDDVLYSFGREDYEKHPFDLILFVLGIEVEREPWGRAVCSRAWNFDPECISSSGDYTRIVHRLCELAGHPDALRDVSDVVNLDTGEAWVQYTINGTERHWTVDVTDDWADMAALREVMKDLQHDGRRFYFKDNGQAMVLFYLTASEASELNTLTGNAVKPVISA